MKIRICEEEFNFMHREIQRIVCSKKLYILTFYRHLEIVVLLYLKNIVINTCNMESCIINIET